MTVDVTQLRTLLDQLETEASEAEAAKVAAANAQAAATQAAQDAQAAADAFAKENDESRAKMQEIIAQLQAALADA